MGCDAKLDVFDWLADVAPPDGKEPFDCVEVRFKNERKDFYRNVEGVQLHKGDVVVVEATQGHDVGVVSLAGELVRLQMQKKGMDPASSDIGHVLRKAEEQDIQQWRSAREKEDKAQQIAIQRARELGLDMKISDVEYRGDEKKATFFYTADNRVDFRELVKILAGELKTRIEMHQIGARQEAAKIGGIGTCGRPLCCSTWLTDFRSVSTSAARYQQLSLNPEKLAGQCGKLKCCLNFELDMYLEALQGFPDPKRKLITQQGIATHFKTDIFKGEVWYIYEKNSNDPVPLSVARVNQIIAMNDADRYPATLEEIKENSGKDHRSEKDLADQESITRFDAVRKKDRKGRQKKHSGKDQGASPKEVPQNSGSH